MFSYLDTVINNILSAMGLYGALFASFLILIESILPVLPLSVFITINFYTFGTYFGFLISYILTVIGCNLAFYISRRIIKNRSDYLIKKYDKNKILGLVDKFGELKLSNLCLIMVFPFTPAFLVNIVSGISNMNYNKFLIASLISKPFMVYFWGYMGVTLIQSLTHPTYLIKILIIMIIAYTLSYIINKKYNL